MARPGRICPDPRRTGKAGVASGAPGRAGEKAGRERAGERRQLPPCKRRRHRASGGYRRSGSVSGGAAVLRRWLSILSRPLRGSERETWFLARSIGLSLDDQVVRVARESVDGALGAHGIRKGAQPFIGSAV